MLKMLTIFLVVLLKPITYGLNQTDNKLKTGWYYIDEKAGSYQRQLYKSNEKYFINPQPIVLAKHFITVELSGSDSKHDLYILIRFDATGASAWEKATGKSIHKKLALIIDDKLIYTPQVEAQITAGISALNPGVFSQEEMEHFEKILKSEMSSQSK